jgi:hypothetical protein
MIRFWDFKLTGAPPLLSWVVRRNDCNAVDKNRDSLKEQRVGIECV